MLLLPSSRLCALWSACVSQLHSHARTRNSWDMVQADAGISLARELVQNDTHLKSTASPWSAAELPQPSPWGAEDPAPFRRSQDVASQSSRELSPLPSGMHPCRLVMG